MPLDTALEISGRLPNGDGHFQAMSDNEVAAGISSVRARENIRSTGKSVRLLLRDLGVADADREA